VTPPRQVSATLAQVSEALSLRWWHGLEVGRLQGLQQRGDMVGEWHHGGPFVYFVDKVVLDELRASSRCSGMAEGKKTMIVSVRLDESTYAGLEALAKADRRKLATYLALVLEDHLAAKENEAGESKPRGRR